VVKAVVAALAFVAAAASQAYAQPAPRLDPQRLESFVDGAVRQAMADGHDAGVTVAVVDRYGPLLVKGYGRAKPGTPVDADTTFRVGSISKTITWIAIMQLVAEGKLALDDPINDHLPPELRIPDDGFREPILVRHLMTHSAGFEDAILGVNVTLDQGRLLSLHDYLMRYRVRRVRPPGETMVYSNYGAALAGAIVEHETRRPFVDYAEQRILRPLHMDEASFREPYDARLMRRGLPAPLPPDLAAHAASGFRFADGRFQEQPWEFLPHMAPAGALSASARDMAAYMQALLDPQRFADAGVLDVATARDMRGMSFQNDPRLGGNRHGFWDIAAPTGEFAFGHNGAMAFQQASLGIYTGSGLGIFVASNSASLGGGPLPIFKTLPNLILKQFFPVQYAQRVDTGGYGTYAGCYRPLRRPYRHTEAGVIAIGQTFCVTPLESGDLMVGSERYEPIGNGVYARPDLSDRVAFRWRNGRLTIGNFGGSSPAERVAFYETPNWLVLAGALALLAALVRLIGVPLRLISGREGLAQIGVDATALVWLAGAVLFCAAALPWLADQSAALLDYPGTLLPMACWLFLLGAVGTLASAVLLIARRPEDGRDTIGPIVSLVLFAVFAASLYPFGFLGFSGW
jgi:CubicO group peptidase (beta-lactamase class C family)